MESVDQYCSKLYHIASYLSDPSVSPTKKDLIYSDALKSMAIGSFTIVVLRFVIYKRHYLLKNYFNSVLLGSALGISYSPLFLSKKIDNILLN